MCDASGARELRCEVAPSGTTSCGSHTIRNGTVIDAGLMRGIVPTGETAVDAPAAARRPSRDKENNGE